jgi:hypothetical protein
MAEAGLAAEGRDADAAPPAALGPAATTPARFRREGEYWTIAYEGKQLRLRDAKGLQYIADLLRQEGDELHAADLAAGSGASDRAHPDPEMGGASGLGDAGEVLDHQARAKYRQRLADLRGELDEATRWGDLGRTASLREEIEFLRDELSGPTGSAGGRARRRT